MYDTKTGDVVITPSGVTGIFLCTNALGQRLQRWEA